jgi:hypothetical protein
VIIARRPVTHAILVGTSTLICDQPEEEMERGARRRGTVGERGRARGDLGVCRKTLETTGEIEVPGRNRRERERLRVNNPDPGSGSFVATMAQQNVQLEFNKSAAVNYATAALRFYIFLNKWFEFFI